MCWQNFLLCSGKTLPKGAIRPLKLFGPRPSELLVVKIYMAIRLSPYACHLRANLFSCCDGQQALQPGAWC